MAESPRRRQILEALAAELEEHPGDRVTTARLAQVVGVSEAALYRHFPSKADMFAELIAFSEESVFGIINRISREERRPLDQVRLILGALLTFSERNPGITRVLIGDALVGEIEKLRIRVNQYFERLETQLRQVLREGASDWATGQAAEAQAVAATAQLLTTMLEGRMRQYVRSGFERKPLLGWDAQWTLLAHILQPTRGRADPHDLAPRPT
jgi:TetR/AcrR family transcriptional regulator